MLKGKILLVEDEMHIRLNIKSMLELEDYQVVDVTDGIEALSKLENEQFDLVITDIMMQNINGFELLEIIRSNDNIADLAVILVTAKSEKEILSVIANDKKTYYLAKPFSFAELINSVEFALR